ncbi:MAG: multicopper oxidase domain-containing protein [Pseudomonadota bacterium]
MHARLSWAWMFALAVSLTLAWPGPDSLAGVVDYHLVISRQELSPAGRPAQAMTVNGAVPGPTLRFREGDTARIRVENRMDVETSIHWHGILVPPGMDGVPEISFPAIAPGATFTYQFPIRQSGTYWYHSHSHFQEQRGVYGALVIAPALAGGHGHAPAPREAVVVVSDWTNQDPHAVLRTLKRGSDWYALEKGSGQSLLGAARLGLLGDYLAREWLRMPAMDISDVAYDAFLANGRPATSLEAKAGEVVRVRLVNGSASTYFHLQFAGGPMTIVSADGQDVEPVEVERLLVAVAETYDLLVRLPGAGAFELRATAHDGSGHASYWIGRGMRTPAPAIPRPNLYHGMGVHDLAQTLALTPAGTMGMSDRDVRAGRFDQPGMLMHMDSGHGAGMTMPMAKGSDHAAMPAAESAGHAAMPMAGHQPVHEAKQADHAAPAAPAPSMPATHGMAGMAAEPPAQGHGQGMHMAPAMAMPTHAMAPGAPPASPVLNLGHDFGWLASDVASAGALARDGGPERPWPPYAQLRATRSTALPAHAPLRQIRLTLDGDMKRYVWLLGNKPLSEQDDILIHRGEAVRLILINRTMMHHPMHLHGHFFRVVNGRGDRSPLKHTVDVAPMSTTVIEFDADETGDWFFQCHLLYHLMSGMARVVRYQEYTPPPEVAAIRPRLYADSWWFWGQADLLSQMSEGYLRLANTRQTLNAAWEVGWQRMEQTGWEALLTWAYHFDRFLSVFAGADNLGQRWRLEKTRGVAGVGYLLPFNLETRLWVDSDGGFRARLERSFQLTPRLALNGEAEYDTHARWEGAASLSYTLTRDLSVVAKWHSEYAWGAGLEWRF